MKQEKEIALQLIEKVRAILSDMPDPQVEKLDTAHYEALKNDTYRIRFVLGDGSKLELYLDEKRPA